MDEYYAACREKVKAAADPRTAVNELMVLSLQDLPKLQFCKFVEQMITLLSLQFQTTAWPTQESQEQFRTIRQQLNWALDFMEQLMEVEKELPPPREADEGCWW